VKQLAEKYHGHMTIRSSQAASSHGTAVSIFLPTQSQEHHSTLERVAS
jgi:hypothetical protein